MKNHLLIRDVVVVNHDGRTQADVLAKDGVIEKVEAGIHSPGAHEVDGGGRFLIPGCVDTHVHFRDPGALHKENWSTGPAAAVSAGVTSVVDMPNTTPTTTDLESLLKKRGRARSLSVANFGLFLGAAKNNLETLKQLSAAENVAGIKIYMGSTTGSLLMDDDGVMEALFRETRVMISVHAEDEKRISQRADEFQSRGEDSPHIHGQIRDPEAAVIAVGKIAAFAERYNHPAHICHLSTLAELALLASRPAAPVTIEACPHHLFLNDTALDRLGNFGKVNPPLRSPADQKGLWQALLDGRVRSVATDHAPHTREEKQRGYWKCPSGMPGVDTSLPLMLDRVRSGELTLERVVELMSWNPSQTFRIQGKGRIAPGYHADMALLSTESARPWTVDDLLTQVKWSPFTGWVLPPKPEAVWVMGVETARRGVIVAPDHRPGELQFQKDSF
ncbi:MAG: Dihydroorotase [Myxococcota bacterium]|nr:Dihydroorotase [Myxococcota bacterium]